MYNSAAVYTWPTVLGTQLFYRPLARIGRFQERYSMLIAKVLSPLSL
jgi:hypothetical protein